MKELSQRMSNADHTVRAAHEELREPAIDVVMTLSKQAAAALQAATTRFEEERAKFYEARSNNDPTIAEQAVKAAEPLAQQIDQIVLNLPKNRITH